MKKVQQYIIDHFKGEQPVGTSFIIDSGKNGISLIHLPSMRVPSRIREHLVIYQCMRTLLMTAMENNVESIVIPAFGGETGGVSHHIVCKMMWRAYDQVMNPPKELSWQYAHR